MGVILLVGYPLFAQVFVRGGVFGIYADSPQRAVLLHSKHPNNFSKHPCPYCKVTQRDDAGDDELPGGELGDEDYDLHKNRRTRTGMESARETLKNFKGTAAAGRKESQRLGVNGPDVNNLPSPWYDKMWSHFPGDCTPPDKLHVDSLVSPPRCIDRLSTLYLPSAFILLFEDCSLYNEMYGVCLYRA